VGGVSAGRRALSSSFFDGFALERVDGVPIVEAFERADAAFAASWWHWFFFAQTAKPAEDIISRDPLARYRVDPSVMGAPNHADWERAVTNPAVVRAMVGDYRAGWEIDRFDEARRHGGALRRPGVAQQRAGLVGAQAVRAPIVEADRPRVRSGLEAELVLQLALVPAQRELGLRAIAPIGAV
jgi:hypothetical protein